MVPAADSLLATNRVGPIGFFSRQGEAPERAITNAEMAQGQNPRPRLATAVCGSALTLGARAGRQPWPSWPMRAGYGSNHSELS